MACLLNKGLLPGACTRRPVSIKFGMISSVQSVNDQWIPGIQNVFKQTLFQLIGQVELAGSMLSAACQQASGNYQYNCNHPGRNGLLHWEWGLAIVRCIHWPRGCYYADSGPWQKLPVLFQNLRMPHTPVPYDNRL